MFRMQLPPSVQEILGVLRQNGFHGFVVGGCVRDCCMGLNPHDYDMTTDATPQEMLECFKAYRTLQTGIKHGTVTVILEHEPFEITTFRIDGEYRDHRHPDSVSFTTDIEKDLARRDFTVNAMAYDGEKMVDPFGGEADVERKIIRCVGEAKRRFDEDGLRILRALRFSSVLGFEIEPETKAALHECRELLRPVSAERIWTEFQKLLTGQNAIPVLSAFGDVCRVFLPELCADAVASLNNTPPDLCLRLSLLLKETDIEPALRRLRADNKTIRACVQLATLPDTDVRHLLSMAFPEQAHRWAERQAALGRMSAQKKKQMHGEIEDILRSGMCLSVRDLAVNGNDLKSYGLRGTDIGKALEMLLEQVLSGNISNDKDSLLHALKNR